MDGKQSGTKVGTTAATQKKKKNFNPFYAMLIIVGLAFCVTAFAYGVMTVRGLQPTESLGGSASGQKLMQWIDENGFAIMMVELVALGVLTFAAIATDEYWTKREAAVAKDAGAPKT